LDLIEQQIYTIPIFPYIPGDRRSVVEFSTRLNVLECLVVKGGSTQTLKINPIPLFILNTNVSGHSLIGISSDRPMGEFIVVGDLG